MTISHHEPIVSRLISLSAMRSLQQRDRSWLGARKRDAQWMCGNTNNDYTTAATTTVDLARSTLQHANRGAYDSTP